jgi:hypothetical protein
MVRDPRSRMPIVFLAYPNDRHGGRSSARPRPPGPPNREGSLGWRGRSSEEPASLAAAAAGSSQVRLNNDRQGERRRSPECREPPATVECRQRLFGTRAAQDGDQKRDAEYCAELTHRRVDAARDPEHRRFHLRHCHAGRRGVRQPQAYPGEGRRRVTTCPRGRRSRRCNRGAGGCRRRESPRATGRCGPRRRRGRRSRGRSFPPGRTGGDRSSGRIAARTAGTST